MGLWGFVGCVIAAVMVLLAWPWEAIVLELLATIAITHKE